MFIYKSFLQDEEASFLDDCSKRRQLLTVKEAADCLIQSQLRQRPLTSSGREVVLRSFEQPKVSGEKRAVSSLVCFLQAQADASSPRDSNPPPLLVDQPETWVLAGRSFVLGTFAQIGSSNDWEVDVARRACSHCMDGNLSKSADLLLLLWAAPCGGFPITRFRSQLQQYISICGVALNNDYLKWMSSVFASTSPKVI